MIFVVEGKVWTIQNKEVCHWLYFSHCVSIVCTTGVSVCYHVIVLMQCNAALKSLKLNCLLGEKGNVRFEPLVKRY